MRRRVELVADVVLLAVFSAAALSAQDFQQLARFPGYIATGGVVLLLAKTITDVVQSLRTEAPPSPVSSEVVGERPDFGRAAYYLAWFCGYISLMALIGIVWASLVFIVIFMRVEAQGSWKFVVVSGVGVVVGLQGVSRALDLFWPPNLLGL